MVISLVTTFSNNVLFLLIKCSVFFRKCVLLHFNFSLAEEPC